MGRKSELSISQRVEAILSLIRREEPAGVIARRYGISENTLYRWRDQFIENGKAGLKNGRHKGGVHGSEIKALKKEIEKRDQVIGELTIANRILKKISDD